MNFVHVMNVDGLLWGISQWENRSETDRPGLPHAAQTKHMLWGSSSSSVDAFWSQKLVDQDRTVCACYYWWIPQFTVVLSLLISTTPDVLEMSVTYHSGCSFLSLRQWNRCFFLVLHTIQTAQPPHTSLSAHVSRVTHSSCVAKSSGLFWHESRRANDSCSLC